MACCAVVPLVICSLLWTGLGALVPTVWLQTIMPPHQRLKGTSLCTQPPSCSPPALQLSLVFVVPSPLNDPTLAWYHPHPTYTTIVHHSTIPANPLCYLCPQGCSWWCCDFRSLIGKQHSEYSGQFKDNFITSYQTKESVYLTCTLQFLICHFLEIIPNIRRSKGCTTKQDQLVSKNKCKWCSFTNSKRHDK